MAARKGDSVKVNVTLTPALQDKLEEVSRILGESVNVTVRSALRFGLVEFVRRRELDVSWSKKSKKGDRSEKKRKKGTCRPARRGYDC